MTTITYLQATKPDLRQAMTLKELVNRLAKYSNNWRHPLLAEYADLYRDVLIEHGYHDDQVANMPDFALDIYLLVLDLSGSKNHADNVAYKLTRTIYGG